MGVGSLAVFRAGPLYSGFVPTTPLCVRVVRWCSPEGSHRSRQRTGHRRERVTAWATGWLSVFDALNAAIIDPAPPCSADCSREFGSCRCARDGAVRAALQLLGAEQNVPPASTSSHTIPEGWAPPSRTPGANGSYRVLGVTGTGTTEW